MPDRKPLVVVDADVLGRGRTGDETYVENLLRSLAPLAEGLLRLAAVTRRPDLVPAGIEPVELPARSQELRMAWRLPRLLRQLRPALAHFQHALPLGLGCPAVLTIHDLSFARDPSLMGPVDRWTFRTMVPRSARRAARVLAVSERTRRDLVELYGIPERKIVVTPNGVDPAFRPDGASGSEPQARDSGVVPGSGRASGSEPQARDSGVVPGSGSASGSEPQALEQAFVLAPKGEGGSGRQGRDVGLVPHPGSASGSEPQARASDVVPGSESASGSEPQAPHRPRYLLYVGAIQARKDPLAAADAAAEVGLPLVVAGPEKEPALARELERRGADLRGYLGKSELAELYRGAACLVFPSRYEGFGLPLLEAMASGTPVAAADEPALREVGGDAAVYAEGSGGLADAVRRALADRERLRAAGLRRARTFSWDETARRTLAVYREILEA